MLYKAAVCKLCRYFFVWDSGLWCSHPPFIDQYSGSELTRWKAIFINNEQSTLSPCPVCHSWARREQKYKHMYLAYILPDTASVLVTPLRVGTLACFLVPGWWCYTFRYRLSLMIADKAFLCLECFISLLMGRLFLDRWQPGDWGKLRHWITVSCLM